MEIDSTRVGADSAHTLSKLFTFLDAEDRTEIAGLFALMHRHHVPEGDVLFRPGSPVSALPWWSRAQFQSI